MEEAKEVSVVGVLDMYGFESLDTSGYEQLLFNYADEKLQKLYLSKVFDAERLLFTEEGLGELMNSMAHADKTTPVIELLENKAIGKPQGVFVKLESYKKNDDFIAFLTAMTKDYKDCKCYEKHKQRDKFIIKHTAKEVVYSAKDFIEKNMDRVNSDVKVFIRTKLDPLVSSMLKVLCASSSGRRIWRHLEPHCGTGSARRLQSSSTTLSTLLATRTSSDV